MSCESIVILLVKCIALLLNVLASNFRSVPFFAIIESPVTNIARGVAFGSLTRFIEPPPSAVKLTNSIPLGASLSSLP